MNTAPERRKPEGVAGLLFDRITAGGPVPFSEFMRAALYDPQGGYYFTGGNRIGPAGDYYTSSNVHRGFGTVLARFFTELWSGIRAGIPPAIVEIGAGTGLLAHDILKSLADGDTPGFDALIYFIVELSPAMREREADRLTDFSSRVRWVDLDELAGIEGVVFSNELFDALPVHRLRIVDGRLDELHVGLSLDRAGDFRGFSPIWKQPSTPRLQERCARLNRQPEDGLSFEVSLDAVDLIRSLSRVIKCGFLVTFDYGDLFDSLYGPSRKDGTVRSFRGHRLVESSLDEVGKQDITASVDFSLLIEYGVESGFEVVSFERQTRFLVRNGIVDIALSMIGERESLENLKERLALKNLFIPGGMSDAFRVLVQRRIEK